jgi:hypothetical protein
VLCTISCAFKYRNIKLATRLPSRHQLSGGIQRTILATTPDHLHPRSLSEDTVICLLLGLNSSLQIATAFAQALNRNIRAENDNQSAPGGKDFDVSHSTHQRLPRSGLLSCCVQ